MKRSTYYCTTSSTIPSVREEASASPTAAIGRGYRALKAIFVNRSIKQILLHGKDPYCCIACTAGERVCIQVGADPSTTWRRCQTALRSMLLDDVPNCNVTQGSWAHRQGTYCYTTSSTISIIGQYIGASRGTAVRGRGGTLYYFKFVQYDAQVVFKKEGASWEKMKGQIKNSILFCRKPHSSGDWFACSYTFQCSNQDSQLDTVENKVNMNTCLTSTWKNFTILLQIPQLLGDVFRFVQTPEQQVGWVTEH